MEQLTTDGKEINWESNEVVYWILTKSQKYLANITASNTVRFAICKEGTTNYCKHSVEGHQKKVTMF